MGGASSRDLKVVPCFRLTLDQAVPVSAKLAKNIDTVCDIDRLTPLASLLAGGSKIAPVKSGTSEVFFIVSGSSTFAVSGAGLILWNSVGEVKTKPVLEVGGTVITVEQSGEIKKEDAPTGVPGSFFTPSCGGGSCGTATGYAMLSEEKSLVLTIHDTGWLVAICAECGTTQKTASPTGAPLATESPVTFAPASNVPITEAPTRKASITQVPVTASPVTLTPVSAAPVTLSPTTAAPTQDATTTPVTTTRIPTAAPTTATTTKNPTAAPTTAAPTKKATAAATTASPTRSAALTTPAPTRKESSSSLSSTPSSPLVRGTPSPVSSRESASGATSMSQMWLSVLVTMATALVASW